MTPNPSLDQTATGMVFGPPPQTLGSITKAPMIRLKRLHCPKDSEHLTNSIDYVNQLRATYPWSQKKYDQTNIDNVMLIQCERQIVGFVEAELRNTKLTDREQIEIYVWHLQLDPSIQRSGYATRVLEMLLEKGVDLEFVIANCNEAA